VIKLLQERKTEEIYILLASYFTITILLFLFTSVTITRFYFFSSY